MSVVKQMKNKKSLNNLRDCVKEALEKGSQRGYEFKTMRHAIIAELVRLGYSSAEIKDKLREWNQKCEKVLPPNEQRRQLLDYVNWAIKHKCKIGCKGLEDFCIGEDKCSFLREKILFNRKAVETLPFDLDEAKRFLETRYRADAYLMISILSVLRKHQIDKGTGEVIFIGVRTIASLIIDSHRNTLCGPMDIHRKIQDLVSEGMLGIVSKGQKGTFGNRLANGYKFLAWRPPQSNSDIPPPSRTDSIDANNSGEPNIT